MIEVMIMAIDSGMRITPELVALAPRTIWAYTGTYMIAPNIATESMKVARTDIVKMFWANMRSGRSGSSARSSAKMNPPRKTAPATYMPTMVVEFQSYMLPPQVVASRIRTSDGMRVIAPHVSNLVCLASCGM